MGFCRVLILGEIYFLIGLELCYWAGGGVWYWVTFRTSLILDARSLDKLSD